MKPRDTIRERIFQDWLDTRALKYQGLTFTEYTKQVLDTVPDEKADDKKEVGRPND